MRTIYLKRFGHTNNDTSFKTCKIEKGKRKHLFVTTETGVINRLKK